jgi:hypothetical protein
MNFELSKCCVIREREREREREKEKFCYKFIGQESLTIQNSMHFLSSSQSSSSIRLECVHM